MVDPELRTSVLRIIAGIIAGLAVIVFLMYFVLGLLWVYHSYTLVGLDWTLVPFVLIWLLGYGMAATLPAWTARWVCRIRWPSLLVRGVGLVLMFSLNIIVLLAGVG